MKGCLYTIGILVALFIVWCFYIGITAEETHYYKTLDGKVYTSEKYRNSTPAQQRKMRQDAYEPQAEAIRQHLQKTGKTTDDYKGLSGSIRLADEIKSDKASDHKPYASESQSTKESVSLTPAETKYNRITFAAQFRELTDEEIKWCTDFLIERNYSDAEYKALMDKCQQRKPELLKEWIKTGGW
jgi:hypothetical protein